MKVKEFIQRNDQFTGLYVSTDGRWSDTPRRGFEFKTRAEILGETPAPIEPEIIEVKEEKKQKKNKK